MVAESSNIPNKGGKIDSEIKIMEEDELLLKCSECGKALDSMDQLNLHTLEHLSELINSSNINQKLAFRVEDGGKNKQHQTSGSKRTAHRKQTNRALICQICDKCFSR
jgi:ribosomal protein L34E